MDETSDAPSAPAPPPDDAPSVGFDGLYGLNLDMTESREAYNVGAGLQAHGDDAGTRATEAKFVWRHDWDDANGPRRMGTTNPPLSQPLLYRCLTPMPPESDPPAHMSTGPRGTGVSDSGLTRQGRQRSSTKPTVLYSHYGYITIGNLPRIPHEDANYLEAQGCLHIPTRPALDDFVEQYFTHMHVFLPLLNEGDFWDMYLQHAGSASPHKISLLVFQAMLFSSCSVSCQLVNNYDLMN